MRSFKDISISYLTSALQYANVLKATKLLESLRLGSKTIWFNKYVMSFFENTGADWWKARRTRVSITILNTGHTQDARILREFQNTKTTKCQRRSQAYILLLLCKFRL